MSRISMIQQIGAINSYFPNGIFIYMGKLNIVWEGELTPSPNSITYRIRVQYSFKKGVSVYVISPIPLPLCDGKNQLPHVYSHKEQRLCLYYPDGIEWSPSKYLVKTIFPWASEWLLHYELWLITGEWHGGGKHLSIDEKNEQEENETK